MIIVNIINAKSALLPGNLNLAMQKAKADETTAEMATVNTDTVMLFRKFVKNFFWLRI